MMHAPPWPGPGLHWTPFSPKRSWTEVVCHLPSAIGDAAGSASHGSECRGRAGQEATGQSRSGAYLVNPPLLAVARRWLTHLVISSTCVPTLHVPINDSCPSVSNKPSIHQVACSKMSHSSERTPHHLLRLAFAYACRLTNHACQPTSSTRPGAPSPVQPLSRLTLFFRSLIYRPKPRHCPRGAFYGHSTTRQEAAILVTRNRWP